MHMQKCCYSYINLVMTDTCFHFRDLSPLPILPGNIIIAAASGVVCLDIQNVKWLK